MDRAAATGLGTHTDGGLRVVKALSPPGGDLTIPCWVARPGAIGALRDVGDSMFIWTTISSINGTPYRPCFASETTLAETICRSRGALRARLADLRSVPGLLFEVKRPRRSATRIPTVCRWATDPLAHDCWYLLISRTRLPAIAEEYALGGDWLLRETEQLARHAARAYELGERIKIDLLTDPGPGSIQDGGGR